MLHLFLLSICLSLPLFRYPLPPPLLPQSLSLFCNLVCLSFLSEWLYFVCLLMFHLLLLLSSCLPLTLLYYSPFPHPLLSQSLSLLFLFPFFFFFRVSSFCVPPYVSAFSSSQVVYLYLYSTSTLYLLSFSSSIYLLISSLFPFLVSLFLCLLCCFFLFPFAHSNRSHSCVFYSSSSSLFSFPFWSFSFLSLLFCSFLSHLFPFQIVLILVSPILFLPHCISFLFLTILISSSIRFLPLSSFSLSDRSLSRASGLSLPAWLFPSLPSLPRHLRPSRRCYSLFLPPTTTTPPLLILLSSRSPW